MGQTERVASTHPMILTTPASGSKGVGEKPTLGRNARTDRSEACFDICGPLPPAGRHAATRSRDGCISHDKICRNSAGALAQAWASVGLCLSSTSPTQTRRQNLLQTY